jgi:hypothetical protein
MIPKEWIVHYRVDSGEQIPLAVGAPNFLGAISSAQMAGVEIQSILCVEEKAQAERNGVFIPTELRNRILDDLEQVSFLLQKPRS